MIRARPALSRGSDPRLLEEIRRRIRRSGPIPFAEFMDLALYHPEGGYYSRPKDRVGREEGSDYYTAPTRHPAFGALLGRQVAECLERVGGSPLHLIEFGPGGGGLMASLLRELRVGNAALASSLSVQLVEFNPHRMETQRLRLAEAGVGESARWITPADWRAGTLRLRGCILANEVLDALPVHRLIFRGDRFQEIFVDWNEGLVEVLGPPSSPELLRELHRHPFSPREGQEVEVGLEAIRWVSGIAARLERGYAILTDYGHLAPEMFSPRHHRGTLLAYHRHRLSEDYLDRVGDQDLTAHVNFSSVLEVARESDLIPLGPVPQGRFLLALGALERIGRGSAEFRWEDYQDRRAIQDLFLPAGLGESHRVLVLATPGVELDLTGLRAPDRWEVPPPPARRGTGDREGES